MSGPGGIIRPDGERENGAQRVRESWSVGQLLAISAEQREAIVDAMPPSQRVALAELARYGLDRAMRDAERYNHLLGRLLLDRATSCSMCGGRGLVGSDHMNSGPCPDCVEAGRLDRG